MIMNSKVVLAVLMWGMFFSIHLPARIPISVELASTWGVDPEVQPYVRYFYESAAKYGAHVTPYYNPVYFVDGFDDDVIGVCGISEQYHVIELSYAFWVKASKATREILVLHELSHCILNQDHRDFGIMQPYLLRAQQYKKYKEFFLWELFSFVPQVSVDNADK
jgi:hypothetical protein